MIEVALVFNKMGEPIHWHVPPGASGGAIPDSRNLWDVLWENRHNLGGVAHTHPWNGSPHPSITDVTTFDAVEKGLGQSLVWPIVTMTDVVFYNRWHREFERLHYFEDKNQDVNVWEANIEELRRLSHGGQDG